MNKLFKYTFRPHVDQRKHSARTFYLLTWFSHRVRCRCRKTCLMPCEKGNHANILKYLKYVSLNTLYPTLTHNHNEFEQHQTMLRDLNLIFKPLNSRFENYLCDGDGDGDRRCIDEETHFQHTGHHFASNKRRQLPSCSGIQLQMRQWHLSTVFITYLNKYLRSNSRAFYLFMACPPLFICVL